MKRDSRVDSDQKTLFVLSSGGERSEGCGMHSVQMRTLSAALL